MAITDEQAKNIIQRTILLLDDPRSCPRHRHGRGEEVKKSIAATDKYLRASRRRVQRLMKSRRLSRPSTQENTKTRAVTMQIISIEMSGESDL